MRFSDDAIDRRGMRIGQVHYHLTGFAIFGLFGPPLFVGACRITNETKVPAGDETRPGQAEELLKKSVFYDFPINDQKIFSVFINIYLIFIFYKE